MEGSLSHGKKETSIGSLQPLPPDSTKTLVAMLDDKNNRANSFVNVMQNGSNDVSWIYSVY